MENKFVQIRFTEPTKHGEYSDNLYFPYDTFDSVKQEDIDAEKAKRVANWISVIEAPVAEPTKEQLEAEVASLEAQKLSLDEMISAKQVEIATKIDIKPIGIKE